MRNAVRITVASMGAIVSFAGAEHGIGEILQGSTAPDGVMILSWPDSEFFSIVGGEPAMTLIPNLLASGILTILLSLIFLVWATMFVQRRHGPLILFGLCIALLLVGGGFGPPLTGAILSTAATGINAPLMWQRNRLPDGVRRFLGSLWAGSLTACIAAWLMVIPGLPLLAYFAGMDDTMVVLIIIASAFGFLLLNIVSALAHDAQWKSETHGALSADRSGVTR